MALSAHTAVVRTPRLEQMIREKHEWLNTCLEILNFAQRYDSR
jgi:hypothetical protein